MVLKASSIPLSSFTNCKYGFSEKTVLINLQNEMSACLRQTFLMDYQGSQIILVPFKNPNIDRAPPYYYY